MRAVLLLLLTACGSCSQATLLGGSYEAVILRYPTMPKSLAVTTCSLNNLPMILIDSATWESKDVEIILAHERVHAERAYAYRGGCWPYMYRVARDSAFRAREQFIAFCEASRFALKRNRNPESLWEYIVNVMRQDTLLTSKDNCLFQPWEK